jgi:hypothetical protein
MKDGKGANVLRKSRQREEKEREQAHSYFSQVTFVGFD